MVRRYIKGACFQGRFFNQTQEGKKMKQFRGWSLWVFVFVLTGIFLVGCAGMSSTSEEDKANCLAKTKIHQSLTEDTKLMELSCAYKKFEGADVVHLKVGLQNVSNEPKRFKVHLFLDDGKAVGGLIPRKIKKGLVKPGQTASFVYPVNGMTSNPKEITLNVMTIMP
jgi:hypothetical protein